MWVILMPGCSGWLLFCIICLNKPHDLNYHSVTYLYNNIFNIISLDDELFPLWAGL